MPATLPASKDTCRCKANYTVGLYRCALCGKRKPGSPAAVYPPPMPKTPAELLATGKWTAQAIRDLGNRPLAEIAADLGITVAAVALKHKRLGIPPFGARTGPKPARGAPAHVKATIRLTPAEREAMTAAAGDEDFSTWARRHLRRAAGLE